MIVNGRITLFGEYLMHSMTEGYMIPTVQALATPDEEKIPIHADYYPELDRVRIMLKTLGLPTCAAVRGTLPLGHGFASSTALTFLHLGTRRREYAEDVIRQVDREMHGFSPSGVDYWSIISKRAGYFGPTGWRSAPDSYRPAVSALLVPENSQVDLTTTRNRITRAADTLIPIARYLHATLETQNTLDYRAMLDYAMRLRRIGVYLPRAEAIIDHMTSLGLVAKGIGGLTNKAVIILWPPEVQPTEQGCILAELSQYGPDTVLPRI